MRYSSGLKSILVLLLLLLFLGCDKRTEQREVYKVAIDFTKAEDLLLTDLFQNIKFVPLESSGESPITACDHMIKVSDDKIGILKIQASRSFYLFGLTGEYLFSLSGMGEGPGSFLGARDFLLDHNDQIIISDPMQSKLVVFDEKGILLKQKLGVPSLGLELARLPNDDLLICPKNGPEADFGLIQVNDSLQIKKELFPISDWQKALPLSKLRRYVESAHDGAFYYDWFDDHIYWTDGHEVQTLVDLYFEQGHIREADKKGLSRGESQYFLAEMLNDPTLYSGRSFHYIDGYLFTVYLYEESFYLSIIDVNTGQNKLFHLPPRSENFLLLPEINTTYAGSCYYLLEANYLIDYVLPIAKEWPEVDFTALHGLSHSDNPVVAVAEIDTIFIDSILSTTKARP